MQLQCKRDYDPDIQEEKVVDISEYNSCDMPRVVPMSDEIVALLQEQCKLLSIIPLVSNDEKRVELQNSVLRTLKQNKLPTYQVHELNEMVSAVRRYGKSIQSIQDLNDMYQTLNWIASNYNNSPGEFALLFMYFQVELFNCKNGKFSFEPDSINPNMMVFQHNLRNKIHYIHFFGPGRQS